MMSYVYTALWLVVGLILIFRMGKENKLFYAVGGFFILLGMWWLLSVVTPWPMFTGVLGWVLKGITAAAIVLMIAAYVKSRKEDAKQDEKAALDKQTDKEQNEDGHIQ